MIGRPRHDERGITIGMVVLGVTIVSMIILVVGVQAMSSMFTTRQKSERSVGMAAADSGIEKIRVALQAGLADETDGYTLTKADLQRLVEGQTNVQVVDSRDSAWGMSRQLVDSAQERVTVVETTDKSVGYWQVYNVVRPHYQQGRANDLVVYVRAWATSTGSEPTFTNRPKIFRVEFRPGLFSDYQFVSNAPFWVDNANYVINGPIHSNDYDPDNAFRFLGPEWQDYAIRMMSSPSCGARASFSTSRNGRVRVAGASCAAASGSAQRDAREVSLLGVKRSIDHITARCGRPGVLCPPGRADGQNDVRLLGTGVSVNGTYYPTTGAPWNQGADDSSLTVLLPGDITLSGSMLSSGSRVYRVTVANRQLASRGRPANIFLDDRDGTTVGSGSLRDSVGLISMGNVVLPMRQSGGCLRDVRVAAIAMSGSFSLAPEWVLANAPPVNLSGRLCTRPLNVIGSIATHGQFVASLRYPDATRTIGYRTVNMNYDDRIYRIPPPFYPATLPWAMTNVQDADGRCLTGPLAEDPYCGAPV